MSLLENFTVLKFKSNKPMLFWKTGVDNYE